MSRATPGLVIDSVTGVDVSLAVAGPGARSLAFLIDFGIRAVLVVAWYALASVLYNGELSLAPPLDPDGTWYVYVALPAVALFALYHCVLEIGMRGRTPGKRIVGVRIVARDGAVPSVASHLVRNVFRIVDSLPVGYGVGLTVCLLSQSHVRLGDFAAGTLLVYDELPALGQAHLAPPPRLSRLDVSTLELINELLDRWTTLEPATRQQLARTLIRRASGTASAAIAESDSGLREQLGQLIHRERSGAPS